MEQCQQYTFQPIVFVYFRLEHGHFLSILPTPIIQWREALGWCSTKRIPRTGLHLVHFASNMSRFHSIHGCWLWNNVKADGLENGAKIFRRSPCQETWKFAGGGNQPLAPSFRFGSVRRCHREGKQVPRWEVSNYHYNFEKPFHPEKFGISRK